MQTQQNSDNISGNCIYISNNNNTPSGSQNHIITDQEGHVMGVIDLSVFYGAYLEKYTPYVQETDDRYYAHIFMKRPDIPFRLVFDSFADASYAVLQIGLAAKAWESRPGGPLAKELEHHFRALTPHERAIYMSV